ncbi:MAG: class I SAM-dependent methyltransferase [Tatlockia sp.]|nr:class I SAM-dependent methyltransferase [Tatlockia sp.]
MTFNFDRLKIHLRNHILPAVFFQWRAKFYKIHDADLYRPTFQPWRDKKSLFHKHYREIRNHTLLGLEGAWVLYNLAQQALELRGDFIEAGVYRGGSARILWQVLKAEASAKELYLLDTFEGMPATDKKRDLHKERDFMDTSLETVSAFVGKNERINYVQGLIPQSFINLKSDVSFAFAHIDLDIYESILNACEYIYPKMKPGGFMVFDDYGVPSCPGARVAIDKFFADKPEIPLVLHTGQAIVFKIE